MPGQPTFPGWLVFNVSSLTISDNIVAAGTPFTLSATFDGTGSLFEGTAAPPTGLEGTNQPYTARFYAEGIGAGAPDIDLGNVAGNLSPAGGPYNANLMASIGTPGLYRIGCTVTMNNYLDIAGFQENVLLQVHPV